MVDDIAPFLNIVSSCFPGYTSLYHGILLLLYYYIAEFDMLVLCLGFWFLVFLCCPYLVSR